MPNKKTRIIGKIELETSPPIRARLLRIVYSPDNDNQVVVFRFESKRPRLSIGRPTAKSAFVAGMQRLLSD